MYKYLVKFAVGLLLINNIFCIYTREDATTKPPFTKRIWRKIAVQPSDLNYQSFVDPEIIVHHNYSKVHIHGSSPSSVQNTTIFTEITQSKTFTYASESPIIDQETLGSEVGPIWTKPQRIEGQNSGQNWEQTQQINDKLIWESSTNEQRTPKGHYIVEDQSPQGELKVDDKLMRLEQNGQKYDKYNYKLEIRPKENTYKTNTKSYSNMAFENCPKNVTGPLAYLWSCTQFLNCWKGRGFVQNCAPGTKFNPVSLECDYPHKVSCISGAHDQKVKFEKYSNAQDAISKICEPNFSGLLPHPTDCTKFVNCALGQTYIQDCGPGTAFNSVIQACDYPHNVGCDLSKSKDNILDDKDIRSNINNHLGHGFEPSTSEDYKQYLNRNYGGTNIIRVYDQNVMKQQKHLYLSGHHTAHNTGQNCGSNCDSSQQTSQQHTGQYSGQNTRHTTGLNTASNTGQNCGTNCASNQQHTGQYSGNYDQNIGRNTGLNTGSNTGQSIGRNTGLNAGSNTGESTDHYSQSIGRNTGQNCGTNCASNQQHIGQYSGNYDQNIGRNTGLNTGSNTGQTIGRNTGLNTGSNTGESTNHYSQSIGRNTGLNTGSNTGQNCGSNCASNQQHTGQNIGQNTGNYGQNCGTNCGPNPQQQFGQNTNQQQWNKPGQSVICNSNNCRNNKENVPICGIHNNNCQGQNSGQNNDQRPDYSSRAHSVQYGQNFDQTTTNTRQNRDFSGRDNDNTGYILHSRPNSPSENHNNGENTGRYTQTTISEHSSTQNVQETSKHEVKCPKSHNGLLPHPYICEKFLNCANGATFIQDCGPGTVFNPSLKVCDWPYNVKCTTRKADDKRELSSQNTGHTTPKNTIREGHNIGWNYGQNTGHSTHSITQNTGHYIPNIGQRYDQTSGQSHIHSASTTAQHTGQNVGQSSHSTTRNTGQYFVPNTGANLGHNTAPNTGQRYDQTSGQSHIHSTSTTGQNTGQNIGQSSHTTTRNTGQYFVPNTGAHLGHNTAPNTGQRYDQTSGQSHIHSTSTTGQNTGQNIGQSSHTITRNTGQYFVPNTGANLGHNTAPNTGQRYDQTSGQSHIHSTSTTGQNTGQNIGQSSHTITRNTGQYFVPNTGVHHSHNTATNTGQRYDQTSGQSHIHSASNTGENTGQNIGQSSHTTTRNTGEYFVPNTGAHHSHNTATNTGQRYDQTSGQSSHTITRNTGVHLDHNTGQNTDQTSPSTRYSTNSGYTGIIGYRRESSTSQPTHNDGIRPIYHRNYSQSTKIQNIPQIIEPTAPTRLNYSINVQENTRKTGKHWPAPFPSTDTDADYYFEEVTEDQTKKNGKKVWKSAQNCYEGEFECAFNECIPERWHCDGEQDCRNGEDEKNCKMYLKKYTTIPNSRLYKHEVEKWLNTDLDTCANYCLNSKSFVCKSFNFRKDENVCLLCDTNVGLSGALANSKLYDYYELMVYSINCSNMYKCSTGKCINHTQICDGHDDCSNRQDEKYCSADSIGYEIRLAGSQIKNEGRIEVKVFNEWGYICDDKFGLRNGDVVCKELGYKEGALETKSGSFFARDVKENETFYLMDDVQCIGNETSIRNCDFNGWGTHNCMPQEIVGVVCKTPHEVCPVDHWKCDTTKECLPLLYVCDGVVDCEDRSDEGIQHCEAPIELRLVNGSSKYEGRVEIRYHGVWGTICDDDFTDNTAKIVCKSFGFHGSAVAKKEGAFGSGEGPIWLDQLNCFGNESSVEECAHWNWGEHNCEHSEDAGVVCSLLDTSQYEKNSKDSNIPAVFPDKTNVDEALFKGQCGFRGDDLFTDTNEDSEIHFRVVKGSKARKGDYPWQATVRVKGKNKSTHWCGAVVVSNKYVLTAAHCLVGFSKGSYIVRAGDYDVNEQEGTEVEAFIEDFFVHERFRQGGHMNNDIALIKLKGGGLKLSKHVQPICLPEQGSSYKPGLNCTISGFGSTGSGISTSSHVLRSGWVTIQAKETCIMPQVYGDAITDGMFCAGSLDEGVDSCDGDSGGPLACLDKGLFTLYGITSWGQRCGHINKPGVYVKVSKYRDWIEKIIQETN